MNFSVERLFSKFSNPGSDSSGVADQDEVAAYYDDFTNFYLEATGDFLQAYRSFDTDSLMEYLVESMGLKDGMNLLDAGSGVCAPATWIAKRFPEITVTCITNSEKQYRIANDKLREAKLENRITLIKGDYHRLSEMCDSDVFDAAMFLESLGHNQDLEAVFKGLDQVVKAGGHIYIKDFFRRLSNDPVLQEDIDKAIAVINRNYLLQCHEFVRTYRINFKT